MHIIISKTGRIGCIVTEFNKFSEYSHFQFNIKTAKFELGTGSEVMEAFFSALLFEFQAKNSENCLISLDLDEKTIKEHSGPLKELIINEIQLNKCQNASPLTNIMLSELEHFHSEASKRNLIISIKE